MNHSFTSVSFALLAMLAIAPTHTAQAQESVVTTARYLCDDGDIFRAELYDDYAIVSLPDDETLYTLPAIQADSGTAYSDGTITLHTEDDEAFVEIGDEVMYEDCEAYRVGSAEYTESETATIIERRTIPDYDRPVIDFDRPESVTAPEAEAEPVAVEAEPAAVETEPAAVETEPAAVEDDPEPIRGLW